MNLPDLASKLPGFNELLVELYRDLAAPGVRQVGKALETVMQLGNNALLPIRLLNKVSAEFERQKFQEIADRFSKIPLEKVVEVRPEIAAPILDALSVTVDSSLRSLFVELLAKAAEKDQANLAHPSFTKIIEQLVPDEAVLIQKWRRANSLPYITVSRQAKDSSATPLDPIVFACDDELIAPQMIPTYLAHLSGIGILQYSTMSWLVDSRAYEKVVKATRAKYPSIREHRLSFDNSLSTVSGDEFNDEEFKDGDVFFEKGIVKITPYGRAFIDACIEQPVD